MIERLKRWASELRAQLLTVWFCRTHPGTPWHAKLLAALVVAYAFSPIDLIPDFIPVIGYLDDLILVPLGIYLVLRMVPEQVLAESRQKAEQWIAGQKDKPRSYVAAALILLIWIALAYWGWTLLADLKKP